MAVSIRRLCRDTNKEYHANIIAGSGGMDNRVNWVHMIEDYDAVKFLHGNEIVITTGIGNVRTTENMLKYVKTLNEKNASGVIFNIGPYIETVPKEVLHFCDEVNLPVYTVPWEVKLVDLTQHFCKILIENDEKVRSLTSLVKDYIFRSDEREKLYADLTRNGFAQHLNYCVINFGLKGVDGDMVSEEQIEMLHEVIDRETGKMVSKYVVFKQEMRYVLIIAGVKTSTITKLIDEIKYKYRGKKIDIYISASSNKENLIDLPKNFKLSECVYRLSIRINQSPLIYDDLDTYKILFSITDKKSMKDFVKRILGPIIEFDEGNGSDYIGFLKEYIIYNGNIQQIANELYVHRNTIHYKVNKINEIANIDLSQFEDLLKVQICMKLINLI